MKKRILVPILIGCALEIGAGILFLTNATSDLVYTLILSGLVFVGVGVVILIFAKYFEKSHIQMHGISLILLGLLSTIPIIYGLVKSALMKDWLAFLMVFVIFLCASFICGLGLFFWKIKR
ncbi:MAG: hypothetical protein WC750_04005 [Patescibacteria group bacterium]|jgi:hypothetical protein